MRKSNFIHASFFRSEKQRNIFDLDNLSEFPFPFLRFEPPRDPRLICGGAKHVIESFVKRNKVLHSGLIPISNCIFYGNNLNEQNKTDFLIIIFDKKDTIEVYLFPNRNPINKSKFTFEFLLDIGKIP
ncbi:MAG: hypothetical protein JWN78_640 [Bacteroidota bacterium]|nr:hypothetical protein [Bacteroidota bacterium]